MRVLGLPPAVPPRGTPPSHHDDDNDDQRHPPRGFLAKGKQALSLLHRTGARAMWAGVGSASAPVPRHHLGAGLRRKKMRVAEGGRFRGVVAAPLADVT